MGIKKKVFGIIIIWTGFVGLGHAQSLIVWPGDANNNGIANHTDLLYAGLNFGLMGPGRDSVSINWVGHSAFTWLNPVGTPFEPAYADCNGDSLIDAGDLNAILQNFGRTHGTLVPDSSSISNSAANPLLAFDFGLDSLPAGSRDTINLMMGSFLAPVDSLYGISFTISFDTSLVDTIYADFSDSWLSPGGGSSLLKLEYLAPGSLFVAVSRTDRVNAYLGSGRLGGIVVVMDDNLKTSASTATLQMGFAQVLAMKSTGNIVPLFAQDDSIKVFVAADKPTVSQPIRIFPNPATTQILIEMPANESILQGEIWTADGKRVRSLRITHLQQSVNTTWLPPGIYFLRLRGSQHHYSGKFILLPD